MAMVNEDANPAATITETAAQIIEQARGAMENYLDFFEKSTPLELRVSVPVVLRTAHPTGAAPSQHDDLLTQHDDLGFNRRARPEQIDDNPRY
jgi:hypothetical protein